MITHLFGNDDRSLDDYGDFGGVSLEEAAAGGVDSAAAAAEGERARSLATPAGS